MTQRETVLFANEAFYRAFADKDYDAMDTLWSALEPCSCIHPGWGPIFGREEVLQSWAAIIENPESPELLCHDATVSIFDTMAMVICFEEIAGQFLVATNVFVREGSIWKMVHHQAGPTADSPEVREAQPDDPVH